MSEELSPRQIRFLKLYNDPKSPTFGNAYQSAKDAEYSEEYAQNLTGQMPDWLSENIRRRKRMLMSAENNLEEALNMEAGVVANKDGELVEAKNIDVIKVKVDVSKFVAKTLGKDEGYSERTELTGKDGKELPAPIYGGKSTEVQL